MLKLNEVVYKDTQITQVSNYLGISKVSVDKVLTYYVDYLKEKLEKGETIKFLNICYLRVNGKQETMHETLAYVSDEIGSILGISQVVVLRILSTYEEILIKDLKKLYAYSIRGLIRIRLEKNYKGEFKVRTKKSTVYNGKDIYVTTTNSFKRKVEIV